MGREGPCWAEPRCSELRAPAAGLGFPRGRAQARELPVSRRCPPGPAPARLPRSGRKIPCKALGTQRALVAPFLEHLKHSGKAQRVVVCWAEAGGRKGASEVAGGGLQATLPEAWGLRLCLEVLPPVFRAAGGLGGSTSPCLTPWCSLKCISVSSVRVLRAQPSFGFRAGRRAQVGAENFGKGRPGVRPSDCGIKPPRSSEWRARLSPSPSPSEGAAPACSPSESGPALWHGSVMQC